jgi:hypothetical protein
MLAEAAFAWGMRSNISIYAAYKYGCLYSATFIPLLIFRVGHERVIASNLMGFARYSKSYKEPTSPTGSALLCLTKRLIIPSQFI